MSVYIGAIADGRITKISKLKRGDYFRKVGGKKVFIYKGKDRAYGRYGNYLGWEFYWQYFDDINQYGRSRKDIDVEVDFTF